MNGDTGFCVTVPQTHTAHLWDAPSSDNGVSQGCTKPVHVHYQKTLQGKSRMRKGQRNKQPLPEFSGIKPALGFLSAFWFCASDG